MSKILETGIEIGGGAGAGYLDAKFPDKKIANQGLGTVLAAGGLLYGFLGKGKLSKLALELGGGAAAFEVGKLVANKTAPGSVSGVRGVRGALPRGTHVVTASEIRQAVAAAR